MLILHGMKGMGSRACTAFSYFLMGLDIALAEAFVHPACWAFAPITSFLAVPMGLLAVILAMLAHWVYYLFSRASTTHLLYFYLFHFPFSLTFPYCWASSTIGLFVKNGHQQSLV